MTSTHWADAPLALISETGINSRKDIPAKHPAVMMAQQMALAHNSILRSLNASMNQCQAIKAGSTAAADFLVYNQFIYEVLKQHHDIEEEYLFGALETLMGVPGGMDQNLQEHKDFEAGLENFRKYVFNTSAQQYDGNKLRSLLDSFGKIVEKHLHNEIPTLLDLHRYDAKKLGAIGQELGRRFSQGSDKYNAFIRFVTLD
ncbi:hypothetical protein K4F52_007201 [Lecanicillium sp. MT-2017a]|nr:hypothetical protein K4F52_007201 [Lecanicillium sp. MT-2017a]